MAKSKSGEQQQQEQQQQEQQETSSPMTQAAKLKQNMPISFIHSNINIGVEDCDRPACDDWIQKLQTLQEASSSTATTTRTNKNQSEQEQQSVVVKEALPLFLSLPSSSSADPPSSHQQQPQPCPPTSGQIGKAGWTLLHSMAAWYPDDPTDQDRHSMTSFMTAFARFYPCSYCAKDFQYNLQAKPVQTSSRKALCTWVCEQHNIVNMKLGKPAFSCELKDLDDRWRKNKRPECQKPYSKSSH